MIFVALEESARKGELLLVDGGLCRFHCRRDGVVVIRELIVLPTHRRRGIGRSLVAAVRDRHPGATVRAVCPGEYEANLFWRAVGFAIVGYRPPDGRLALWEWTSSIVPTGIPSSPTSQ